MFTCVVKNVDINVKNSASLVPFKPIKSLMQQKIGLTDIQC
ncbi:Uncharacterized protein YR821_1627 [Yersinia ruckeri]|uniref:Uncharacterized protein n=1 Tax=Yersinia ruckeri TaxID=29486 RepID=A0A0A8VD01_YERRU|nr:hypothetical protein yruck0001_14780 [Yersinia ruckeri ATCC 29473]QTD76551.1 Uncharacterized protein YR821_1627 [Yersinia ruckeri]CEK27450.1 hypothetical protein CSF007_8485 [Yersinia ruckeri]